MPMGPFHQKWAPKGKVGDLFGSPLFEGKVSYAKLRQLLGHHIGFYQLYVFKSYDLGVDVYVRRAGARPIDAFWKYYLDVPDPAMWWKAMSAKFIGVCIMPEWADGMAAIMGRGHDRSKL